MKNDRVNELINIYYQDDGHDKETKVEAWKRIATYVHQEVTKARLEELKLCRIAILKDWGMNHCKNRIEALDKVSLKIKGLT